MARKAGTISLVTSPASSVSSSTIANHRADPLGRVDDRWSRPGRGGAAARSGRRAGGDRRGSPRCRAARRAGGAGRAQRADELVVERAPVVRTARARRPSASARAPSPRGRSPADARGAASRTPSRLQHPHALEREQRAREQRGRARAATAAMRSPSPTETIISGTSALRAEERARAGGRRAAVPSTPSSTVAPATPRRCSSSTTASYAGLPSARSLAADVDGQLGRLVQRLGEPAGDRPVSSRARSSVTSPSNAQRARGRRARPRSRARASTATDDERQVLRQRQQPVGAQVVLGAEALRAAQTRLVCSAVARVDVDAARRPGSGRRRGRARRSRS